MKFKPTLWKVIVSIALIIIWYTLLVFFSNSIRCNYYPCPSTFKGTDCEKVFVLKIIPSLSCDGGCFCPKATTLTDILKQLIILLLPGILIYVIWSLFQKNKINRRRRI